MKWNTNGSKALSRVETDIVKNCWKNKELTWKQINISELLGYGNSNS